MDNDTSKTRPAPKNPRKPFVDRACTVCGIVQGIDEFWPNRTYRDGHERRCKTCRSKAGAARNRRLIDEAGGSQNLPGYPETLEKVKAYRDRMIAADPEGFKERRRASARRSKYNISDERYAEMLARSEGLCGICKDPMVRVCIDHDHTCCPTEKKACGECIRELLCLRCNMALGLMLEDPARFAAAIEYLARWPKRFPPTH